MKGKLKLVLLLLVVVLAVGICFSLRTTVNDGVGITLGTMETPGYYVVFTKDLPIIVNKEANQICPMTNLPCVKVKNFTYFGYEPKMGDIVSVRQIAFWYFWEEATGVRPIATFNFVAKSSPPAEQLLANRQSS